MKAFRQDLRYGARILVKNPGFTLVAILALVLGIGANSAIFSVVNAVVLRPLPYAKSDQLVLIGGNLHRAGFDQLSASAPEFTDYRQQTKLFEYIAAYYLSGFNLTGLDEPERLQGASVSAALFPLLGIQPEIGRAFREDEDLLGHDQVAVISHSLWQRRFGLDPSISGRTIVLDGKPVTIVGVMPPSFSFPDPEIQIWKPIAFDPELLTENNRGSHFLTVIARIKDGVTFAQAQSEIATISSRMSQDHRNVYKSTGFSAKIYSLQEQIIGDARLALFVLLAAVGFVLLIACANVANLLIAKVAGRSKEVAIRSALGASRARIISQFLTESLLLASLGGAFGLMLAWWGVKVLVQLGPSDLPRLAEVNLDPRVLLFTTATSVLTGLLFGLVPALHASRPGLLETLKQGGRTSSERTPRRLRGALVIAEFSLALVLLIGAVLMIRSFSKLHQVDPGFRPENLVTFRVVLPRAKYSTFQQQAAFYQQAMQRIGSTPGIVAAGATNILPFSGFSSDRSLLIEGRPVAPGEPHPDEQLRFISPNYFKAMGAPLLEGRDFTDRDASGTPRVAIVDQSMAERYWPSNSAVGKRIAYAGVRENKPEWIEIVGVAKNIKYEGVDSKDNPQIYLPCYQPLFTDINWRMPPLFLVVRSASPIAGAIANIRAEVAAIDKDQPLSDVKTMQQRMGDSVARQFFSMLLLGLFATLAMVLALVGIYGIMSYSVSQRTNEIGVRLALGAQTRDIIKLVVREGMVLAVAGVLVGIAGAAALTRLMATLLFNVSALDPFTFAVVPILLAIVAFVACYVPARRATKVDPMVALRYE